MIYISLYTLIVFYTFSFLFFFNDPATTDIYTLSLHDALPISSNIIVSIISLPGKNLQVIAENSHPLLLLVSKSLYDYNRSEEHTSELQSRQYLVCRLLLEKKKKKNKNKSKII